MSPHAAPMARQDSEITLRQDRERVLEPHKFRIKDEIHAFEERADRVCTTALGPDGNMQILRYDMRSLVRYSALLTILSKGTVFTMDNTALLNVACMMLIGMGSCGLTSLAALGGWDHLANLNTAPLDNLAEQINAFVPPCLALYVTLTLSRWWALRIHALGRVFDAFANAVMLVSCELNDKKWRTLRNQVAKYGFASVELMMQAARADASLDQLQEYDLLSEAECQAMEKVTELNQRPMVLWAWIMQICVSAMDHEKVNPGRANSLMMYCIAAREGMATINTYLDTQLPFAYVHLITLLVNVQNVVVSVKSGVIVATAMPSHSYFLMMQQAMLLILVCFIYQALLQISYVLMDPFGDDILDFPIKAYTSYLAASIDAVVEAQPECPVVCEDGSLHRPKLKKPRSHSSPRTPQSGLRGTSVGKPSSPMAPDHRCMVTL